MKKKKYFKKIEKLLIILLVLGAVGSLVKAVDKYSYKLKSGDNDNCPEDMVFVGNNKGGFCMDIYENSAGTKCEHQNPSSEAASAENINDIECKPISAKNKSPWVNITKTQATIACGKAGKRMPTAEEWYQASMGTPDKNNDWSASDCQVNKNWEQQPGPTGSGNDCLSSVGAYDMIGNVWEWVKNESKDGNYKEFIFPNEGYVKEVDMDGMIISTSDSKPEVSFNNDYFWIKNKGIRGMAKGGYWDNGKEAGIFSAYIVLPPNIAGSGIGFRCVK